MNNRRSRKVAVSLVLVAGVVALGLLLLLSRRVGERMQVANAPVAQVSRTGDSINLAGAGTNSGVPPSAVSAGTSVMTELRATYRPGGLPARIRLQGELSERWEKQVPTAAEVIGQIADTSAPDEHRVFIAQSFRNLAKMNRVMASEAADVVDRLLAIVGDAKDSPLVRGQLAVVLVGFDKSPEAVRTIAPLLNDTNDDAGALAVTALRHAATDQAATALYDYLQRDTASRYAKSKTTGSALLALTGYGNLDVVPIAKEIIGQPQSLELLQAALVSLSKAKSTTSVVEAILVAYDNSERPTGIDPARIRNASLAALRSHSEYISSLLKSVSDPILQRARDLLVAHAEKK